MFTTPWGTFSFQEETPMLNILTGDPDLYHPEDAEYSKQLKETTYGTYLLENSHTGQLTKINYLI
jgi:hypothetical protein